MLVIPRHAVSAADLEKVRYAARDAIGADVEFQVEVVDRLIQEQSGKFKLVRSSASHSISP